MYKLLIIDDEIEQRKDIYNKIFASNFTLEMVSNDEIKIVEVLKTQLFDGVILDSTLKSGTIGEKVKQCIKKFDGPIILVSDKREFDDSDRADEKICDCISLRPLFNCMETRKKEKNTKQEEMLLAIEQGIIKDIQYRTRFAIERTTGYSDKVKHKKLSICHIADLQFGDPDASKFDLETFFARLTTYLRDREPKPDLVVIAGDIAFSGKKKEYEDAEKYMKPFLKALYGDEYYKHLVMVPGNHDYYYSTCLIDESMSERILGEPGEVKEFLVPSDFIKFSAPDSANHYFCDFAYRLTKNPSYWKLPLKIENRQLMPYGYRILGIANAMQYQALNKGGTQKRYILDTKGLKVEQAATGIQPPTIVVGHISPKDLGYKDVCPSTVNHCNKFYGKQCQVEEQCRKWITSQVFMEAYNASVYLYGHQHFSSCEITDDKTRLFIAAGTPSGINSEMTFNIIEIEDGMDEDILTLIVNNIGGDKISLAKCEKYIYKKRNKEWKKEE